MDVEGFFQSWTLGMAVITSTGAGALVLWKLWRTRWLESLKGAVADAIGERMDSEELVERLKPELRTIVAEEVQTKLDNGSRMSRKIDQVQRSADRNATIAENLSSAMNDNTRRIAAMDVRVGNIERQLENVITEELAQITVLAEAIVREQETVAIAEVYTVEMVQSIDRAVNTKAPGEQTIAAQVDDLHQDRPDRDDEGD